MTRYRAAEPAALLVEPLDALTAVFHRTSGVTHLLAEPAPQILAALQEAPPDPVRAELVEAPDPGGGGRDTPFDKFRANGRGMSLDELLGSLARDHDLVDADPAALAARLDELVATGLVNRE